MRGDRRDFQLNVQQTVEIEPERLQLCLVRVVEDSRCPVNAICLDPGRARIVISLIADGNKISQHELTLERGQETSARAYFRNYLVEFIALEPYPGTPAAVAQGDTPNYIATLAVSPHGSNN